MTKTLRVIDPFFIMELGDIFEYSDDLKMYVSKHKEEFFDDDNFNSEIKSSFNSEFQISEEYAKTLLNEGYIEEVEDNDKRFVNIFDEIDSLISTYSRNLENIDKDMKGLPACLKTEKETVLTNLITVLKHLKSLKK